MAQYTCDCSDPICDRHYAWALIDAGYQRMPRNVDASVLFWAKVERIEDPARCWNWLGARNAKGYGKGKFHREWASPHRFSYELHIGPIPEGLEIDHLCRNTSCVNPAHLEAVTPAENMARRKVATTHCKRGHEFTPENTRFHSVSGSKVCVACAREYQREWMRRYRERKK